LGWLLHRLLIYMLLYGLLVVRLLVRLLVQPLLRLMKLRLKATICLGMRLGLVRILPCVLTVHRLLLLLLLRVALLLQRWICWLLRARRVQHAILPWLEPLLRLLWWQYLLLELLLRLWLVLGLGLMLEPVC